MRGDLSDLDPIQAAVLYSIQHAREDLEDWVSRIPEDELWMQPGNVASVGFHVRHIAGSVDRLATYAAGQQLTDEQMNELRHEHDGNLTKRQLFELLENNLRRAETIIRSLNPTQYRDVREIGRKRIQVPLGTLLVHMAEHTQRHVGELIVTVKVIREEYR